MLKADDKVLVRFDLQTLLQPSARDSVTLDLSLKANRLPDIDCLW